MVVIEDIKGNTTITRVMETTISTRFKGKSEGGKYEQWHGWVPAHGATSRAHAHLVLCIDHGSSLHQRIHEVEEPTKPHHVQGRRSL